MKKTLFIKNAAVLTFTGIMLRVTGMIFRIVLSSAIGKEGMGLYFLIFSAYTLFGAFASCGVTVAVTKCVADCVDNNHGNITVAVKTAVCHNLILATISFCLMFVLAYPVARYITGDINSMFPIRIIAFAIPFISVSGVLKGYFCGVRKIIFNSVSEFAEQTVRILFCLFFLTKYNGSNVIKAINYVCLYDVIAEAVSCIFLTVSFILSAKKEEGGDKTDIKREINETAVPLNGSRYVTGILRTAENFLLPFLLSLGSNKESALSVIGLIKAMVIPVLFFPSSLLSSVSSLLIPELSSAVKFKNAGMLKNGIEKTLKTAFIFGFSLLGVFFFLGGNLGEIIYRDSEAGKMITLLSPLVPFMYADTVSTGLLKGINEEKFCFYNSLKDSVLRIGLMFLLVPKFSSAGFIAVMYVSNLYTCIKSCLRLKKKAGIKLDVPKTFILPAAVTLSLGYAVSVCLKMFGNKISENNIFVVSLLSVIAVLLYFVMIFTFKAADINDYMLKR